MKLDEGFMDLESICKESAILDSTIKNATIVMQAILDDESTAVETAIAYAMPVYGYDKNALMADVDAYTTESGEGPTDGHSTAMKIISVINETVKKAMRIFYVLFKKIQQKVIEVYTGIAKHIATLSDKVSKKDFGTEITNENLKKELFGSMINAIPALYAVGGQTARSVNMVTSSILKSFTDVLRVYSGYTDVIKTINAEVVGRNDLTDTSSQDAIAAKYANMVLDKCMSTPLGSFGDISKSVNAKKDIFTFDQKMLDNGEHVVKAYSTDGKTIYLLSVLDGSLLLVPLSGKLTKVDSDSFKGNLLKAITKESYLVNNGTEANDLLKVIKDVNVKDISEKIRQSFSTLENAMANSMRSLDKIETTVDNKVMSHFLNIIFSQNVSTLNKISFDHVNNMVKLTANVIRAFDKNLDCYEDKK